MGIFSRYLRAHKVEELPTTNIDKQAIYIVSDGKSDTFMIAVRDIDNTYWRVLKELPLGTTENTAAAGNHTHSELHTHSNQSTLDTITEQDLADYLEAHKKTVTSVSFTGDVNKTLTITRQDGTTLTASFVDKEGDGGGVTDGVLNTLEFNDTTGVLTATVLNGTTEVPIDVNLDGRYSLITHTHEQSEINGLIDALNSKVDKEAGKELSSNDFSDPLKEKLEQQRETIIISGNKFTYIPAIGNNGSSFQAGDIAKDGWINESTFGSILTYKGTGDATLLSNWETLHSVKVDN